MKRLLSVLAAASTLLVAGAAAAPAASADAPEAEARSTIGEPPPATQVWATRAVSKQGPQPQIFLRLDVEQLSPRVVMAGSSDSVTISGKITNVGDRLLRDIDLRLERGNALTKEEEVRTALREGGDSEVEQPLFTKIADKLERGESKDFTLTVPLHGDDPKSLRVDEPGIYPVLANINGTPDFGGRARLAALSTLLPVLTVPGGTTQNAPGGGSQLTLLWPLADRPRVVEQLPGDKSVLTDDELAASLARGGRLYGLLEGYKSALDGELAGSVCLAVDPDLLRTVKVMSQGYQVRGQGAGKGGEDAKLWLDQLRRQVSGKCVVALADADADLVALSRAGLGDLASNALTEGARVVGDVLESQKPLQGVVWPEDGVLDQATLDRLTGQGVTGLVLEQQAVAGTTGTGPVTVGGDKKASAARVDTMVSDALVGTTSLIAGATTAGTEQAVSVQNALAALAFRTGFQGNGQNVVVAPPRRWNAPEGEITMFLQTMKSLVSSGYAKPVGLESLLDTTPSGQSAALSYPVEAGAAEVSPVVTAELARAWRGVQDIASSMSQQDAAAATPEDLVAPLRLALLRAASGAWRGDEAAARRALSVGLDRIDGLESQVTVAEPASPILLGSDNSPIPVNISNKLDVRITVRVVVEDVPGVSVTQMPDLVLPARGARQVMVPLEALRFGKFSVHVRLTTPNGVELGDRARLEVSSNSYGTITIVITGAAAALLVLLSGRRIYRRVRASKAAAARVADEIQHEDQMPATPEKSSAS
ncbi:MULTISPECIES: DUF6049 family protein [Actinosynnema]|uniref:DUF6049 family protein n=1 Tax=Actinosynnema TaxID=40566 RepID=UPI0020A37B6E|nr:DUF6049 family protein [Actinosynnema pretiosum]MCP2093522.1 hypothetical protein [Actinosynnema pretiosum]